MISLLPTKGDSVTGKTAQIQDGESTTFPPAARIDVKDAPEDKRGGDGRMPANNRGNTHVEADLG